MTLFPKVDTLFVNTKKKTKEHRQTISQLQYVVYLRILMIA